MKGKACCFTGHRPSKLGMTEQQLRPLLEEAIRQTVKDGFTTFITGMAMGTDLVAGEIVLQLREQDSRLKLVCALPYPNFGQHWGGGWTKRFQKVLAAADLKRCICPSFYYASYQLRNEWMVDHASLVIAVYNGQAGGTRNTLDYARKMNVPCRIIKPER